MKNLSTLAKAKIQQTSGSTIIYLGIILSLAAFLRLYRLGDLPALNADEAAIAYNAYSLLKTGKDEFGTSWPLVFTSFNDFKPGVYFYMVLPFVAWLGLTVWAVRLPAVLLSLISVVAMYFLSKRVVGKSFPGREYVALLSSLALAISPWHIHFTRGGWETQVATAILLLGTICLIKGLRKRQWLLLGILLYGLALYTYHSMRIVAPLLGITFAVLNWHTLWEKRGWLALSALTTILISLPLIVQLQSDVGLSRAQGVSIFSDSGPVWRVNELRGYHDDIQNPVVRLLHNRMTAYIFTFFNNYLEHFSGNFLFVEGDEIQRNKVPEFGQLLFIWIPLLLAGIEALFKYPIRHKKLLVAWLLIAPIPSALTFQSPHAVRAFSMSIPLSFLVALGAVRIWRFATQNFKAKWLKPCLGGIFVFLSLWSVTRYWFNYYYLMVPRYPFSSQYGFEELVPWVETVKNNYDVVWVTDAYDQPYILFLFYMKYAPEKFQLEGKLSERDSYGFSTVRDFDVFHFEGVDIEKIRQRFPGEKVLIIGTDKEIPEQSDILKTISLGNGHVIFQAVEI